MISNYISAFYPQVYQDEYNCSTSTNSNESLQDDVYPRTKISYKLKMKTEICKYWSIDGNCPYGDQCAFAHGKEEMREKLFVPINYKTKICKNYEEDGFCCFGERCQFKHQINSTQNDLPRLPYQSLIDNIDVILFGNQKLAKRPLSILYLESHQ